MKKTIIHLVLFLSIVMAPAIKAQVSSSQDSLKGFTEDNVIKEFNTLGLPKESFAEFLQYKKREFIDNKYGIAPQPIADPLNPPIFDGNSIVVRKKGGGGNPLPLAACNNVDFETGNFAGWVGKYGTFTTCAATCPNVGFIFGRHTIMTGNGFDPIVGGPLKMVSPGGAFSLRLGDSNVGAQAESIEQTFTVQANATSFTYKYAVVLQDPTSGHANIEPSFRIEVVNTATGALVNCAQYYVKAISGNSGFNTFTSPGFGVIFWKDWTTVNVDLSSLIGQTVTVRFVTRDCNAGGHFGYAYLDGDCLGIQVTQSDTLCQGSSTILAAPSGSAAYNWAPVGQTGQAITISNPGSYTVTMTSVQGCQTAAIFNVNQYPKPSVSFTPVQGLCSNSILFNDGSTVTSGLIGDWRWGFGTPANDSSHTQSPTFAFPGPGTYTVSLLVTTVATCKDSAFAVVTVPNQPSVNFSNTSVCVGTATQFTDISILNPGSITQWNWDFGDPSSGASNNDTTSNPTHSYTLAGTYWVKLIATSNQGCTDSILLPIVVNAIPVPNFNYSTVCEGFGTQFNDASFVNPGAVTSWDWFFGDGGTSASRNPSHLYATAGVYSVTLTAISNGGCPFSIVKNVTVHPLPVAQYTISSACLGSPTVFTDQSTVSIGSVTGWSWTFGEPSSGTNNVSNQKNPSHSYGAAGNYTATLTVSTNRGCKATLTQTLTVFPAANPDYNSTTVCINSASFFTDQSTVPMGSVIGWQWDFGEPSSATNTSNATSPSHTYNTCGGFNASLIITTSYGCQALVIKPVNVNCAPVISYTTTNACENTPVQFNNTSSISVGNIASYGWDFGDPGSGATNTDTQTNPTHVFSGTGTYTVSLTAASNTGCLSTLSQTVTIYPKPVASFTYTAACLGTPVVFTDQSTLSSGTISQWSWDFADAASASNTSSIAAPTHLFTSGGVYNVTLSVTSSDGCSDITTVNVPVSPTPTADFEADTVCFGMTTTFNNLSAIGPGGVITSYSWDFGDPASAAANTDTGVNPTHQFSGPGLYPVSFTVTSANGCSATFMKIVEAKPLPIASFTSADVCFGTAMQFNNTSNVINGTIVTNAWNFGDGNTSAQSNASNQYASAGTFTVSLIVTSDHGCKDSIKTPFTVNSIPVVGFTVDDPDGCSPHCVQFTDTSSVTNGQITLWSWGFGDGSMDTLQNPPHCYTLPGIFSVTLTVTSNSNCQNTYVDANMITVHPSPVAAFTAIPQPTTILDPLIKFTDLSVGAQSWYWYFGDGDSAVSADNAPTHQYQDTGRYPVTLIVVNQYGCRDTVVQDVIIGPDFIFYIPNAFTPSEDGVNEFFFPIIQGVKEYNLWIYDRWGNKIWHTSDPVNGKWDGRSNNGSKISQQDVYVWIIRCKDITDKKHTFTGKVTLLK